MKHTVGNSIEVRPSEFCSFIGIASDRDSETLLIYKIIYKLLTRLITNHLWN